MQGLLILRQLATRYSVVLFEQGRLGSGQTLHSQAYLIRGHAYAAVADDAGFRCAVGTKKAKGPLRQGVSAWSRILRSLRMQPTPGAYHLIVGDYWSTAARAWDEAGLRYTQMDRGMGPRGLSRSPSGRVFLTGETFVPDAAELIRRLANPYRHAIYQGEVKEPVATTGQVTVAIPGGAELEVRAKVVVVAGPSTLVPEWPVETSAGKMGALFARGPKVPDIALVFRSSIEDGGL